MSLDPEIANITNQIIQNYAPRMIILFGSHAKDTAREDSDVDLCVVIPTEDKRALLTDMYVAIETVKQFDLILYTPSQWDACVSDPTSFAHVINEKGIVLYAG